jgi:hypothetical protein
MQQFFPPNDFENRTLQHVSRTFAGQYLPPSRLERLNFVKFPPSKPFVPIQPFSLDLPNPNSKIEFLQDILAQSICLKILSQTEL